MDKPVIIFGAKGIAISALDIFESNGIIVYGFLDPDKSLHKTEIDNIPVLGDPNDAGFTKLIGQKCEAFVATDDNVLRSEQVEFLVETRKVMPVNAIHEKAYIAPSTGIGHGNFFNAGVTVGPKGNIGNHCIFHMGAKIDSEVVVNDFVQVGIGSNIGYSVKIGKGAFIGAGVTIVNGIEIGENARVGAGSVVIGNISKNETVFGNPATKIDK